MTSDNDKKIGSNKHSRFAPNIRKDEFLIYVLLLVHMVVIDALLALLTGVFLGFYSFSQPKSVGRILSGIVLAAVFIFYAGQYLIPMLFE